MVLILKGTVKISENLMAIIPRNISKIVLIWDMAFRRKIYGKKKKKIIVNVNN